MSRCQRSSRWLRQRAGSRAAVAAMFVWAFAEALVWPIIPDASLAVLVLARPRRWLVLGLSAVGGSVAGGAAGVLAAAQGGTWPLPLTTPRMVAAVEEWLASGAGGLAHQPLTGVPYKVFVAESAEAGISVMPFVAGTLQYRAPRLIAVAAIVAGIAALGWRVVPARRQAAVHVAVSGAGVVALIGGLAAVVARWS